MGRTEMNICLQGPGTLTSFGSQLEADRYGFSEVRVGRWPTHKCGFVFG